MCLEGPKVLTAFRFGAAMRSWVRGEAGRLAVTSSDVVRGAVRLLQAQPPDVRDAIVRDAMQEGDTPLDRV
jgi:Arc/MetJ-type ribon-helix-helix transcriptional regulator